MPTTAAEYRKMTQTISAGARPAGPVSSGCRTAQPFTHGGMQNKVPLHSLPTAAIMIRMGEQRRAKGLLARGGLVDRYSKGFGVVEGSSVASADHGHTSIPKFRGALAPELHWLIFALIADTNFEAERQLATSANG